MTVDLFSLLKTGNFRCVTSGSRTLFSSILRPYWVNKVLLLILLLIFLVQIFTQNKVSLLTKLLIYILFNLS